MYFTRFLRLLKEWNTPNLSKTPQSCYIQEAPLLTLLDMYYYPNNTHTVDDRNLSGIGFLCLWICLWETFEVSEKYTGRARTVTWPELGRGARVSIPVTIGMTWPPEGLVLFKDGTSPTLPL